LQSQRPRKRSAGAFAIEETSRSELHAVDLDFLEPSKLGEIGQRLDMRQPLQLDALEVATKFQRGKIAQIIDLDEMERFQSGEAPEKPRSSGLQKPRKSERKSANGSRGERSGSAAPESPT